MRHPITRKLFFIGIVIAYSRYKTDRLRSTKNTCLGPRDSLVRNTSVQQLVIESRVMWSFPRFERSQVMSGNLARLRFGRPVPGPRGILQWPSSVRRPLLAYT